MRTSTGKIISLGLGLLFLQYGCGTPQMRVEKVYHSLKTFNKGYDEVWSALEYIIKEELMYPIKLKDKKRGIIETDWISVIRLHGTLRWRVKILLNRRNDKIVVKVYDRVEEPSGTKRRLKKKRDKLETGWQLSEDKIADVDNILKLLSVRLDE